MEAESPKVDPPKRKCLWHQFSLRTLLLFTVAIAIGCACLANRMEWKRSEQVAVNAIREAGGNAYYEHDEPSGPAWLRKLFGENFFNDVHQVWMKPDGRLEVVPSLHVVPPIKKEDFDRVVVRLGALRRLKGLSMLGGMVTDVDLDAIKELTNLESLELTGARVSDSGLQNIKGLSRLIWLSLARTDVSDACLIDLAGLSHLEELYLNGTRVTAEGVKTLQKALPKCRIYR